MLGLGVCECRDSSGMRVVDRTWSSRNKCVSSKAF